MNKKIIIPTIALVALMAAVAMGTMPVNAQSNVYGNLVTKIAQRFNLQESDVQEVVDQVRTEHMAQMQSNWSERLNTLVSEGKITSAQKGLIEAKHTQLQQDFANLEELSVVERKAKQEQIFSDLKAWATANNIDLSLIRLFGPHRGFGMGFRIGSELGH